MARGVAVDLLQMAKRIGPQCKAAEHEDLSGEESFSADSVIIDDSSEGSIKPFSDSTEELSMKAPMSVSKPADLGRGSQTVRLRLMVTGDLGHDVYPGLGPLDGGNTLLHA